MRPKQKLSVATATFLLTTSPITHAYEWTTHKQITDVAASMSVLSDLSVLNDLGLLFPYDTSKFKDRQGFPDAHWHKSQIISELVINGAGFEDDFLDDNIVRVANHFYNPVDGSPLGSAETSPDWALEDTKSTSNDYSLADARRYLEAAITSPAFLVRRQNFGLLFRSLGQVVHHLQDMVQPQHVRSDAHCSVWGGCQLVGFAYNPSAYEAFSQTLETLIPTLGGYPAVYSRQGDSTTFGKARQLWHSPLCILSSQSIVSCRGIADFSNYNFLTAGSIFTQPHPKASDLVFTERTSIQDLVKGTTLQGEMFFYGYDVLDDYAQSRGLGMWDVKALSRAVTLSYFAFDVEGNPSLAENFRFRVNKFTYSEAFKHLVPRAIGYSAGLINFFLRGKLEISPPDEGVYAIVDHSTISIGSPAVDLRGFHEIRLKVKNVPNSSGLEPMSGGTLRAVLKFHRNLCYHDDLSGMPLTGQVQEACRSNVEEIVVSETKSQFKLEDSNPKALTFQFPNELPINATDVYLQLIYRGRFGQEQDAVVVATKDISEPTFYTYQNNTDYIYIAHEDALQVCTGQGFTSHLCTLEQAEQLINQNAEVANSIEPPGCVETINGVKHLGNACHHFPLRMSFAIGNGTYLDIPDPDMDTSYRDSQGRPVLMPGQFVRIAMLGDAGEFDTIKRLPMTYVSSTCVGGPNNFEQKLYKWQLDYRPSDDSEQTYVGTFKEVRGVKQWDADWCVSSGSPTTWEDIKAANFRVMAPFSSTTPVAVRISQTTLAN